jgi:hypothetical protein
MVELIRRDYDFVRHSFPLYISPNELFTPNATTKLFTKAVRIGKGEIVADIGSGVGPLAIWAAKEGAEEVHAVEIVREQYEILKSNVEMNGVEKIVKTYHGSFFDTLPDDLKFDVIISDVSGIAEKIARFMDTNKEPWYPSLIPAGGRDGTEVIGEVLMRAPEYMFRGSRLYFPVAGLSNHEKLMSVAKEKFGELNQKVNMRFPLDCKQVDLIRKEGEEGTYSLEDRGGGKFIWRGWIYEASKLI